MCLFIHRRYKLIGVPICLRFRRWPSDVTAAQACLPLGRLLGLGEALDGTGQVGAESCCAALAIYLDDTALSRFQVSDDRLNPVL
jgi:hypothetical protein